MKITIEMDKKRMVILSAVLLFLLVVSAVTVDAQRSRRSAQAQPQESPSIAAQFGNGFVCMISQCGWPSLVMLILPAIAVFVWKKYISLG